MLQTRTVELETHGLLKVFMSINQIDQFYLVGGTVLALQLGHRFSVDLDFVGFQRNLSWAREALAYLDK